MSSDQRLSRRAFLRRSGAVSAASLGLPLLGSRPVRGAEVRVPPSDRITVGLIGLGKMCQGHLGGLLGDPGVQVLAVCDVESTRLTQARERVDSHYTAATPGGTYKGCTAYRDFRELLARPDLDAVVIVTPEHWHAIQAIEACTAGKDVYCEKPLTLTLGEARAVVDAARRHARIFQTGSQQRSDSTFRFACELVRNGRIGRVHTVCVNVGGPPVDCFLPAMPTPASLDWDRWLGPAPARPYHSELCPLDNFQVWPAWRHYRDFGGGSMTDIGAHHFDIAQWGLGMDDSGPVEIIPPDGAEVTRLTYRYANGVVMYHGGGLGEAAVDFVGTEGRVAVNRGSFLLTEPTTLRHEHIGPLETRLYESSNHMANWLDCIRTRRAPICPAEIGCRSVSVCHLGNLAYWLKRPLKWDPVAERFLDDPEANRLIHRPTRAPWSV